MHSSWYNTGQRTMLYNNLFITHSVLCLPLLYNLLIWSNCIYLYIVSFLAVVRPYFIQTTILLTVNNSKSWFNTDPIQLTIHPTIYKKIIIIILIAAIVKMHKHIIQRPLVRHDLWLIAQIF